MMTFCIFQSALVAGSGSGSVTSRPAPAMRPLSSAATRSASTTLPPRPTLKKYAPGFAAAKNLALKMPVVWGVSGVVLTMKSASAASLCSSSGKPT